MQVPDSLSPLAAKILPALQHQGTSNDCGPYTIATVLNGVRGLNIVAAQLARQMDRPVWRGPRFVVRRIPNWATFPWGMVDVFRSYGLRASWRPLVSHEYLKDNLPRGRVLMPIIHSWRPLWSHVMTLLAWDAKRGWGFANTQYAHHNLNWVSDAVFRKQWGALGRMLIEVRNI